MLVQWRGIYVRASRASLAVQAEQGRDPRAGGAMTIRGVGASTGPAGGSNAEEPASQQMDADMDLARQVQAQMDAEEARRGCASAAVLPRSCQVFRIFFRPLVPPCCAAMSTTVLHRCNW